MSFKQFIILSSVLLLVFFSIILFFIVSSSLEKGKIKKDSERVASLWGTYTYKTFPDEYFTQLKPYYSKSYYHSMAENKQSLGMRSANLKKYQYSFKSTPKGVKQIKKKDNKYLVKLVTQITILRLNKDGKEEKEEKSENMDITWEKENNKYKITSIESK